MAKEKPLVIEDLDANYPPDSVEYADRERRKVELLIELGAKVETDEATTFEDAVAQGRKLTRLPKAVVIDQVRIGWERHLTHHVGEPGINV